MSVYTPSLELKYKEKDGKYKVWFAKLVGGDPNVFKVTGAVHNVDI